MTATILMPRELHEKWDAALRSGKYRQGQNALQDRNGAYCCLGVLQMVVDGKVARKCNGEAEELIASEWYQENGVSFRRLLRIRHEGSYSDRVVDTQTPPAPEHYVMVQTTPGEEYQELVVVNDDCGYNFIQIADIIKANVEYTDEAPK